MVIIPRSVSVILLTLASPVVGFPGSCGDGQLAACAGGTCPDMHGQAPQQGNALDATGKTDGGTYTPGETIALANTGGGQYSLYADANGVQLARSDNAATTVTAPQSGTLTLLSVRAGGRNQCTYELITLDADGTPPGGGGGRIPPPGGVGNVGGVGNGNPGAGSDLSVKGDTIPDAGTGLLYSTLFIMFVHIVQRRVRAFLKARRRYQLFQAREQGRSMSLQAGGTPPPPPTFADAGHLPPPPPNQHQQYGWPASSPPPSPPQFPPPPPPAPPGEFDATSDWTPQWDASGNQYFWNTRTGAVSWEPPGLPAPNPAPPPPPAKYDEGYGLCTAPIEVEILPILPVLGRRQTLSVPKDAAPPRSARRARLRETTSKKARLLDATCGEVMVFSLYVLLNVLWCTLFAKEKWYVADSWGYVASANGLFVVIPASRNSLWAWLLGLPFDKTITIHRYRAPTLPTQIRTQHVALPVKAGNAVALMAHA